MRTTIKKNSALACVFLLLLTATLATSCKKEKMTKGKVTVTNMSGLPLPNATVDLDAKSANSDIKYSAITDGKGLAEFEIPLPAIWDVKVSYEGFLVPSDSAASILTGSGVLRLDEPGKNDAIVIIVR